MRNQILIKNIIFIILFSVGVFGAGAAAINMISGKNDLDAWQIIIGAIGLAVALGIWWMEYSTQQYGSQGGLSFFYIYTFLLGILSAILLFAMMGHVFFSESAVTWEVLVAGGSGFVVLLLMAAVVMSN